MSLTTEELADEFSRRFPKEPEPEPKPVPATPEGEDKPTPPVTLPPACQRLDYVTRGYHLDVVVRPQQVVATAEWLDEHGFGFDTVTGVDWLEAKEMEVVYDYFHPTAGLRVAVRARIPRDTPEIATVSEVFPGANWHERETHDFFGIKFLGHPDLSPLLLPEDADFHPLRKDYNP